MAAIEIPLTQAWNWVPIGRHGAGPRLSPEMPDGWGPRFQGIRDNGIQNIAISEPWGTTEGRSGAYYFDEFFKCLADHSARHLHFDFILQAINWMEEDTNRRLILYVGRPLTNRDDEGLIDAFMQHCLEIPRVEFGFDGASSDAENAISRRLMNTYTDNKMFIESRPRSDRPWHDGSNVITVDREYRLAESNGWGNFYTHYDDLGELLCFFTDHDSGNTQADDIAFARDVVFPRGHGVGWPDYDHEDWISENGFSLGVSS